jgi:hypothetical protein
MNRTAAVVAVIAITSTVGCEDASDMQRESLIYDEAVQAGRDTPVERSVEAVARSLARSTVFVATKETQTQWKTGLDKNGDVWAYFYTSEAELSAASPAGSRFVEMSFKDAFGIVDDNSNSRGIYMNSASEHFYPIPREVFADVRRAIEEMQVN